MNTQEIKEQAHKEFDEKFLEKGPRKNAKYLNGYIDNTSDKIKSFIDSLIDRTVQMTDDRWLNQSANEHDARIRQDEQDRIVVVIKDRNIRIKERLESTYKIGDFKIKGMIEILEDINNYLNTL